MKLNYRDRMILIGVLAVAIILVGIFALIRPKVNDIKEDNASLETVKEDWSEIEDKINAIEPLQEAILQSYNDSQKLAGDFVDSTLIDSTYELDQFMQPYVDECNLEISVLDLGDLSTINLSYYYFEPVVLTSSMFDAADINGNYQAAISAVQEESNSLSQRTEETVMQARYGISAKGTREDIWKFMDKINELDSAILIETVNISDYTFGEDNPASDGRSDVTMIVSLYSVFEMDEPVVE